MRGSGQPAKTTHLRDVASHRRGDAELGGQGRYLKAASDGAGDGAGVSALAGAGWLGALRAQQEARGMVPALALCSRCRY